MTFGSCYHCRAIYKFEDFIITILFFLKQKSPLIQLKISFNEKFYTYKDMFFVRLILRELIKLILFMYSLLVFDKKFTLKMI